jgi:hypothetical protein
MLVANNYIYVIGGTDNLDVLTSTVNVSTINPDGSLGGWSNTMPLPEARTDFAGVVVSGTIYVIGGVSPFTTTSTVFFAKPNPSTGAISVWMTATAALPKLTARQTAASYNGTIYEIGGADLPSGSFYPDVYYASPDGTGDISSWITTTANLPSNLVFASSVAFAGQVYVVGGATNNGTTLTNTVVSNLVNTDRTLVPGGWTNSNVLSSARQRSASVLSDDGWIYVIEGAANSNQPLHTIDYGPTAAAGATKYASSGQYLSSVIDLGSPRRLQNFQWNATVTDTSKLTLTLDYRAGLSPDFGGSPWVRLGDSSQGLLITNTATVTPTVRFVQYRASFNSAQENLTPVLNRMQLTYSGGSPDLIVTNITYPSHIEAGQTQTTTVYIMNQGDDSACPALSGAGRSTKSTPKNSLGASSTASACFFRIELYIDRSPPSGFTDLGNCQVGASPSYGLFDSVSNGTLNAGQTAFVAIPCTFATGGFHTFYAMVDSCDSPGPGSCSSTYGWIPESNESNNVFGPVVSGPKPLYLPVVNIGPLIGGPRSLFLPVVVR